MQDGRTEVTQDEYRHYDDHPDNSSLVIGLSEDESEIETNMGAELSEELSDLDEGDEKDMAYYEKAVQEIAKGDSYSCLICTVELDYTCKLYACEKCYRVYDYECIREWAEKSTSKRTDKLWACPNCFYTKKAIPKKNRPTCWCGKQVNPEPNPLNPNSCGQTCNAKICSHGCSQICHLGPHQECTRMMSIKCSCGKVTKDIACFQRRLYSKGFNCETVCDKLLPCGIHKCNRKCHTGLCGSCPETIISKNTNMKIRCYCGQTSKDKIKCKDVRFPANAAYSKDDKGQRWIGVFMCDKIRKVPYECGEHSFYEKCKAPPSISGRLICEFSPKKLKTCPCGKNELTDLSKPRSKCTDAIPTCGQVCGKMLKCGKHKCPFACHLGDCMDPCTQIEKVRCACEQKQFTIPCGFNDHARCNLKCESLMSCRRHRCTERCCAGRPLAERRRKTMKINVRDLADESTIEPIHICLKDCNLTLSCGIHKCSRKCHAGKCPPCLESDSNDLVCPCGKTIVEAPVRCGTKLPNCPYPCIRVVRGETDCGHSPMPHECHPPDIPCPDCTATVFKPCICGKEQRVRTVCFMKDVSCGKVCGERLQTCYHKCQKKCHEPGACQTVCKQTCNMPRLYCNHRCPKPCHKFEECPDIPCTALVKITCPCGRIEKEVTCGVYSKNKEAQDSTRIVCDEECAVLQRHMQLKEAFGIVDKPQNTHNEEMARLEQVISTASTFADLDLPFTEPVITTYIRHENWCTDIENTVNKLIDDNNRTSLHFKPMRPPQRYFIRELAKAYNLYSESQDPEPNRSVFVKKNLDGSSTKPILSISEAAPLYQSYKKLEKEKKQANFESMTTTRLINFTPEMSPELESAAKFNGFLVTNVGEFTSTDDLQNLFAPYLKSTLVVEPQFQILPERKQAVIYPNKYKEISVNVERDMETLVQHFDFLIKESLLAGGVELCNIENVLAE